jgi:Transglycosylase SLT domain
MRTFGFIIVLTSLLAGAPIVAAQGEAGDEAPAEPQPAPAPADRPTPPAPGTSDSICLMIEAAARTYDLPVDYFARIIWQESHFQPDVVGPATRNGQRAEGIAQFMPGTAVERRLLDPFNPIEALPKSAEFLAELRRQFGNLGLAAAAYNAGPQRLRDFISGARALPAQTRSYVLAVTGRSVDDWVKGGNPTGGPREVTAVAGCHELLALLKDTPNPFLDQLQRRINLVAARPWGVVLNAGFSRERVLAAYEGVVQKLGAILAGHDPTILSNIFRSRGTQPFYQLRVGAETRESANALCGKIMRAGAACTVLRNQASRS